MNRQTDLARNARNMLGHQQLFGGPPTPRRQPPPIPANSPTRQQQQQNEQLFRQREHEEFQQQLKRERERSWEQQQHQPQSLQSRPSEYDMSAQVSPYRNRAVSHQSSRSNELTLQLQEQVAMEVKMRQRVGGDVDVVKEQTKNIQAEISAIQQETRKVFEFFNKLHGDVERQRKRTDDVDAQVHVKVEEFMKRAQIQVDGLTRENMDLKDRLHKMQSDHDTLHALFNDKMSHFSNFEGESAQNQQVISHSLDQKVSTLSDELRHSVERLSASSQQGLEDLERRIIKVTQTLKQEQTAHVTRLQQDTETNKERLVHLSALEEDHYDELKDKLLELKNVIKAEIVARMREAEVQAEKTKSTFSDHSKAVRKLESSMNNMHQSLRHDLVQEIDRLDVNVASNGNRVSLLETFQKQTEEYKSKNDINFEEFKEDTSKNFESIQKLHEGLETAFEDHVQTSTERFEKTSMTIEDHKTSTDEQLKEHTSRLDTQKERLNGLDEKTEENMKFGEELQGDMEKKAEEASDALSSVQHDLETIIAEHQTESSEFSEQLAGVNQDIITRLDEADELFKTLATQHSLDNLAEKQENDHNYLKGKIDFDIVEVTREVKSIETQMHPRLEKIEGGFRTIRDDNAILETSWQDRLENIDGIIKNNRDIEKKLLDEIDRVSLFLDEYRASQNELKKNMSDNETIATLQSEEISEIDKMVRGVDVLSKKNAEKVTRYAKDSKDTMLEVQGSLNKNTEIVNQQLQIFSQHLTSQQDQSRKLTNDFTRLSESTDLRLDDMLNKIKAQKAHFTEKLDKQDQDNVSNEFAGTQVDKLKEDIQSMKLTAEERHSSFEDMTIKFKSIESSVDRSKTSIQNIESQVETLDKEISKSISELQEDTKSLKEQTSSSRNVLCTQETRIDKLDESVQESIKSQLEVIESANKTTKQDIASLVEKFEAANNNNNKSENTASTAELNTIKSDVGEIKTKLSELVDSNASNKTNIVHVEESVSGLKTDVFDIQKRVEKSEEAIKDISSSPSTANSNSQNSNDNDSETKQMMGDMLDQISGASDRLDKLDSEVEIIKQDLNVETESRLVLTSEVQNIPNYDTQIAKLQQDIAMVKSQPRRASTVASAYQWFYMDEHSQIQGPNSSSKMKNWFQQGHLNENLLVQSLSTADVQSGVQPNPDASAFQTIQQLYGSNYDLAFAE